MESSFGFLRFESHWPRASDIEELAIFIHDIKSVWESSIGTLGGIIHVVHDDGNFQAEVRSTFVGGGFSLFNSFVVGNENAITDIGS